MTMTKTKSIIYGAVAVLVAGFTAFMIFGMWVQTRRGYRPPEQPPSSCVTSVHPLGAVVFADEHELVNCARFRDPQDQFNCLWNRFFELRASHEAGEHQQMVWGMSDNRAYEEVRRGGGTVLVRCEDFTGFVAATHVRKVPCE